MTDLNVAQTAYQTALSMNASDKVMLALFEAGIVESNFTNDLVATDHDSLGFLQQRPSQGWPNPTDVPTATRSFVSKATPIQNNYSTAGQLAQAVQRSAFPLKYDAVALQASALLQQVKNGAGNSLVVTPAGNPFDVTNGLSQLSDKLTDPVTWKRAGFWALGLILLVIAFHRLTNSTAHVGKIAKIIKAGQS